MEEKDKRERKKKKYNRKTNQRKDISDVMITMIYDITKYIARNCGLDGQNCIPSSSSTYYA
jgi:alkyl hydroperoxide reductase subunit AhpC